MNKLIMDLRYALRQLRKSPGFTATAIITLALGIGATTAIFTLVYSVMLRSLPVRSPQELYKIGKEDECCIDGGMQSRGWRIFSYDLYKQFRDHTAAFQSLAAFQAGRNRFSMRRAGDSHAAESVQGRFVSGNYFSTFGVGNYAGRYISPADDEQGAPPVAVISYRLWQRRFALDRSIVGSQVLLNEKAVTVIGVTPPAFYGETLDSDPPEVWLPINQMPILASDGFEDLIHHPELNWLDLIGRIPPTTNRANINAQLTSELQQYLQGRGTTIRAAERALIPKQTVQIVNASGGVNNVRDQYEHGLRLLMTVAGFVLLIACANIANLMLVRGMARRQQTSICIALGAQRRTLIRQTLVESVLLSVIGGVAALWLAYVATRAILALAMRGADYVPISSAPSLPVLGFAFLVSLVTGVLFGLAPAWITSKSDPAEALRGANRSTRDVSAIPQKMLVVLQAALSVILLCTAALLTASLRNLQHQDFGFDTRGRLIVSLDLQVAGYKRDQTDTLYRRFDARLSQIPGVTTVSYAMYTPMGHDNWGTGVFIPGQPPLSPESEDAYASWLRVGPHYFEAIGSRIVEGRTISDEDTAQTRRVAVVNRRFVDQHFKGKSAIGEHFGTDPSNPAQFEIVGVAENTKYRDPADPVPGMFFLPLSQSSLLEKPEDALGETQSHFVNNVIIRYQGGQQGVADGVRRALAEIDPNLTIIHMDSFADQVSTNFNQEELLARLTELFGVLALVLASVGLYGTTAYLVERRTSEIGVRMALGASRSDVMMHVLNSAMGQVGLGLLLGVPCTLLAGRALASQLYGIKPHNALVLIGTVLVLALAGIVAALIPARRAASINPVLALRVE